MNPLVETNISPEAIVLNLESRIAKGLLYLGSNKSKTVIALSSATTTDTFVGLDNGNTVLAKTRLP